jgi:hypothetical protein
VEAEEFFTLKNVFFLTRSLQQQNGGLIVEPPKKRKLVFGVIVQSIYLPESFIITHARDA